MGIEALVLMNERKQTTPNQINKPSSEIKPVSLDFPPPVQCQAVHSLSSINLLYKSFVNPVVQPRSKWTGFFVCQHSFNFSVDLAGPWAHPENGKGNILFGSSSSDTFKSHENPLAKSLPKYASISGVTLAKKQPTLKRAHCVWRQQAKVDWNFFPVSNAPWNWLLAAALLQLSMVEWKVVPLPALPCGLGNVQRVWYPSLLLLQLLPRRMKPSSAAEPCLLTLPHTARAFYRT